MALHHTNYYLFAGALGFFIYEALTRFKTLRFIANEVALFFLSLDLLAQKLTQKMLPPPYRVTGECHRCGVCCTRIVGSPPKWMRRGFILQLYLFFHRTTHNFHAVGRGEEGEIIFSCGHLRSDNSCGIYRYRPLICRNFPLEPQGRIPSLLPECSYQITPRSVTSMQSRPSLAILNPRVAVHHPGPAHDEEESHAHYHYVEDN
jgi:Putative zinc- or iron-chelating domain